MTEAPKGPQGPEIEAREPGFSLDQIDVDLGKIFRNLAKAFTHGAATATGLSNGVSGMINALFEAAGGVEYKPSLEERAWLLFQGGFIRAAWSLLEERGRLGFSDKATLYNAVETGMKAADLHLGPDFLKNPGAHPAVPKLQGALERWLERVLSPEEAKVARRLPSYLALALHREWSARQAFYEPLTETLSGPFVSATQMEADWEAYRLALINEMDKRVFDEPFGLSDIYIELRASFEEKNDEGEPQKVVCDLHETVGKWLEDGTNDDGLCIVRGGPGSGKSSFATMLAGRLCQAGTHRVLSFPLQHFRVSGQLPASVGTYLEKWGHFQENPVAVRDFATPECPLVLIFDGLDELSAPDKAADEQAREFLREVRDELKAWNSRGRRVLALVTGRTAAVQASQPAHRLSGERELTVLPYAFTDKDREAFHDPKSLLSIDQRERWWAGYRRHHPELVQDLPESFQADELQELSVEPLLGYLLVRSGAYREYRVEEGFNRNRIYAKLLNEYEARDFDHKDLAENLPNRKFYPQVLETVALASWHGGSERIATVEQVEALCRPDVETALDEFLSAAGGPNRLIAAFYCQYAEDKAVGPKAFEFTHKSFSEYLTARYLVREIAEIHDELSRKGRYGPDDGLADFCRITHQQPMTMDLLRFLRDEIALRPNDAPEWQETLIDLFELNLRQGMPVMGLAGANFRRAEQFARNAEGTLFVCINACARVIGTISEIDWGDPKGAGAFLDRCRGQRGATLSNYFGSGTTLKYEPNYILLSMASTTFVEQVLDAQDLFGADLSSADLDGASLEGAILDRTRLNGASLLRANLDSATLDGAVIKDTCFVRASLVGAYFGDTFLQNVDFVGATLKGAILERISIDQATLDGFPNEMKKIFEKNLLR